MELFKKSFLITFYIMIAWTVLFAFIHIFGMNPRPFGVFPIPSLILAYIVYIVVAKKRSPLGMIGAQKAFLPLAAGICAVVFIIICIFSIAFVIDTVF